jgi:hypothetical protein
MIKHLRRTTRLQPRPHDQVSATHNKQRRRQRPGHHGHISATHNERRRGKRPGHHEQAQRVAPQAPAWAPRSSACDAQRGPGLGSTIRYLRRTTSSATGNGLGITAKYLRCTTNAAAGTTIKHKERRRGLRPGTHDQAPAMHIEAPAWAPRRSTCDEQRAAPRAIVWAPRSSTIKHNERRRGLRPGNRHNLPATRNEAPA